MADNGSNYGRIAKIGCGGMALLFGAPCMVTAVFQMLESSAGEMAGSLGAILFFAMIAAGGGWLLVSGIRDGGEEPFELTEDHERMALRLARAEEGELSVSKLAMKSNLSIEESERLLENLERRGIAYSQVGTEGGVEYRFPELIEGNSPMALEEEIEEAAGRME